MPTGSAQPVSNLDDSYPLPQRHQPQRSGVFAAEQCAAGTQVLLQAVLDYDPRLAEQHTRNSRWLHVDLGSAA